MLSHMGLLTSCVHSNQETSKADLQLEVESANPPPPLLIESGWWTLPICARPAVGQNSLGLGGRGVGVSLKFICRNGDSPREAPSYICLSFLLLKHLGLWKDAGPRPSFLPGPLYLSQWVGWGLDGYE
jgi:hypothetical protein